MKTTKHFIKRLNALNNEFSPWRNYYQDLSDYVLAYRGRFLCKENKIKRNTKQINNKARRASRTLQGGLMAGITSPARPWFKLATPDPDLNLYKPVRSWLSDVERIMREIYSQSNLYNNLYAIYGELGNFAIAPMGVYEHYDNVIHTQQYTVGSYRVIVDEYGRVVGLYRLYQLSVAQLIKKFGKDKVGKTVADKWQNGQSEEMVSLLHVIEPNDDRDHMSMKAWNKPWRSVYINMDEQTGDDSEPLMSSGFDDNPIVCPRWETVGEEAYGINCPAMDCLGDTKALQLGERRSAQAIDKKVDPPLQAPSTFSKWGGTGGLFNGEIVIGDDPTGKGMRSVYDVNFSIQEHEQKLKEIEMRISESFYEDLFRMISNDTRSNITAREIAERHEEKLLMLGSVLERLHNELLDPLIDRTFNICQRAGILPKAPEELTRNGGSEITVNYISILAQAQRMTVIADINEITSYVAQVGQVEPSAMKKFNFEKAIDLYSESLLVDPDLIRSDEEAEELSAQEQQAAMTAQVPQQAKDLTQAANNLATADPAGDLLQQITGSTPV